MNQISAEGNPSTKENEKVILKARRRFTNEPEASADEERGKFKL